MLTSVDIIFNATQYEDAFDETSKLLFLAFNSQITPLKTDFSWLRNKEKPTFFLAFFKPHHVNLNKNPAGIK